MNYKGEKYAAAGVSESVETVTKMVDTDANIPPSSGNGKLIFIDGETMNVISASWIYFDTSLNLAVARRYIKAKM